MHLDRAWIEQHIPHSGRMCLLDEVLEWDAQHIRCRSGTHRAADHPLKANGRLGAACGIEYAAQTMAAHGAALAQGAVLSEGAINRPTAGLLVAVRDVRLHVVRLDDIRGDLICEATRLAGDQATALYEFTILAEAHKLLSGRATVILDAGQRYAYE